MKTYKGHEAVRLFGMTGLQVQTDLNRVEAEYAIKLHPYSTDAENKDQVYYPQFDFKIREEAGRMAQYYELFYCLENSIRTLIASTLEASAGRDWWGAVVPQPVKDEVAKNMKRELEAGITQRSEDPLDYTTFGQLGDVIRENWTVFADTFNDNKPGMNRVLASLNNLRGPIAHCCALADDEVDRLLLTIKDWFRLMGS